MVEKPSRRSSLAFYVANVASEALFRISVARGYVRPINNGQVYIFTLAMATIMLLAKMHGFEDDPLSAAVKLIVGPEEASSRRRGRNTVTQPARSVQFDETQGERDSPSLLAGQPNELSNAPSTLSLFDRVKNATNWIRYIINSRHPLCPHKNCSCLYYTLKASTRALLIGCALQTALKVATKSSLILKNPPILIQVLTDPGLLRMGLFLSTFSGLYKATNCCLRFFLNSSSPINCFLAGLVAGPALFIYPSPTVALYVLWKCLEALFHEAVRKGYIKNKNTFIVILYGLATSQLFYSALMDPRYMKKSYMAFLDRMSHHRLHMVNRSVLDVFGTEASAGYEEFFPDLHPKFMSPAFIGSIWIWMLEQKFVAARVS